MTTSTPCMRPSSSYMIRASKADLSEADSRRYVEILTFTTNLEHIGDIIDKNLMELAGKKIKKRYTFSAEGAAELKRFHGQVMDNMRLALNVFASRDVTLARRLLLAKSDMRSREFESADRHFARLREGRAESIETSSIHLDVIRDLKRINSHLTSVAYPILEAHGELAKAGFGSFPQLMPPSCRPNPTRAPPANSRQSRAQCSRISTSPVSTSPAATILTGITGSLSSSTPSSAANSTLVSRTAATSAIGATLMAQMAIQYDTSDSTPPPTMSVQPAENAETISDRCRTSP